MFKFRIGDAGKSVQQLVIARHPDVGLNIIAKGENSLVSKTPIKHKVYVTAPKKIYEDFIKDL